MAGSVDGMAFAIGVSGVECATGEGTTLICFKYYLNVMQVLP